MKYNNIAIKESGEIRSFNVSLIISAKHFILFFSTIRTNYNSILYAVFGFIFKINY